MNGDKSTRTVRLDSAGSKLVIYKTIQVSDSYFSKMDKFRPYDLTKITSSSLSRLNDLISATRVYSFSQIWSQGDFSTYCHLEL